MPTGSVRAEAWEGAPGYRWVVAWAERWAGGRRGADDRGHAGGRAGGRGRRRGCRRAPRCRAAAGRRCSWTRAGRERAGAWLQQCLVVPIEEMPSPLQRPASSSPASLLARRCGRCAFVPGDDRVTQRDALAADAHARTGDEAAHRVLRLSAERAAARPADAHAAGSCSGCAAAISAGLFRPLLDADGVVFAPPTRRVLTRRAVIRSVLSSDNRSARALPAGVFRWNHAAHRADQRG